MFDLVALTGIRSAADPKARRMALASATSPTGVEVAWALMWTMSASVRPARSTASRIARLAPAPVGSGAVMWLASEDMPIEANSA